MALEILPVAGSSLVLEVARKFSATAIGELCCWWVYNLFILPITSFNVVAQCYKGLFEELYLAHENSNFLE